MKVELQKLTKIFPSRSKKKGEEVVAVNNFTFTIPDGKLVGLRADEGADAHTRKQIIAYRLDLTREQTQLPRSLLLDKHLSKIRPR